MIQLVEMKNYRFRDDEKRYAVHTNTKKLGYVTRIAQDVWFALKLLTQNPSNTESNDDQLALFDVQGDNRYQFFASRPTRAQAVNMLKEDWRPRKQEAGVDLFINTFDFLAYVFAEIRTGGIKQEQTNIDCAYRAAFSMYKEASPAMFTSKLRLNMDLLRGIAQTLRIEEIQTANLIQEIIARHTPAEPTPEDLDNAKRAIQWGQSLPENDESPLGRRCASISRSMTFHRRELFLASMVAKKYLDREKTTKEAGVRENLSSWVGERYKEYECPLCLFERKFYHTTRYEGVVQRFVDEHNNIYVSFVTVPEPTNKMIDKWRESCQDYDPMDEESERRHQLVHDLTFGDDRYKDLEFTFLEKKIEPLGWGKLLNKFRVARFVVTKHGKREGVKQNIIEILEYGEEVDVDTVIVDPVNQFRAEMDEGLFL